VNVLSELSPDEGPDVISLSDDSHDDAAAHMMAAEGEWPVIDPYADDGVWIALDEGCNTTCHSQGRARNAEQKFRNLGFRMAWIHKNPKKFRGIGPGPCTATGKRAIPMGSSSLPAA
jgi:hypothetical protein